LESLAALLGLYFIPIVANDDSPVHSALRLWNEDPTLRLAIVDLKMPNEAGEETLETGFELIQELRKRPGSIVVVHSGFSDPALQQRAKELGCSGFFPKDSDPEKLIERLQALAVAQIDWLATKPPSLPATNSATESLDAINSVAEARHITDRAWFLSNPALWPERQQQVVSVFDQTILGQGVDFGTAYEAARKQCAALSKPCPNQYDLTFVVVPDVVEPDPAPDWNPLKSTLS
jgi:DNA-binding NarL/FixJ family response regulator